MARSWSSAWSSAELALRARRAQLPAQVRERRLDAQRLAPRAHRLEAARRKLRELVIDQAPFGADHQTQRLRGDGRQGRFDGSVCIREKAILARDPLLEALLDQGPKALDQTDLGAMRAAR